MTVLGPIAPAELGPTLPHEHIFLDMTRWPAGKTFNGEDGILDPIRHGQMMRDELKLFQAAGGSAVVDVTPRNLGGDVRALKGVAEDTGVHIVAGCGWYRDSYMEPELYYRPTGELADELVREIEQGVAGSDIRPGIIGEVGADGYHLTATEERCLRAAAKASRRTGLAITTHLPRPSAAMEALDVLAEHGVPPERIVVGHADGYEVLEYQLELLKRGVYVEFEIIWPSYPFARVASTLDLTAELVRRGYAGHIVMSHDICAKSHLKCNGGWGFAHLLTEVLPQLRERGVSEEAIQTITVENPRSVLTV